MFDNAVSFPEGMAAVEIDEKWGFVDKKGDLTIEPKFTFGKSFQESNFPRSIESFSDSLAAVFEIIEKNFIKK